MGSALINVKEGEKARQVKRTEERKRIEAQRVKPITPSRATAAFIGEDERNGKPKKKSRNREDFQPSYPGPFSHLLRRAWIIQ